MALLTQEERGRVIYLETSLPPCPGSTLQQEVIPTGSLHKTSTHSPLFWTERTPGLSSLRPHCSSSAEQQHGAAAWTDRQMDKR